MVENIFRSEPKLMIGDKCSQGLNALNRFTILVDKRIRDGSAVWEGLDHL